MRLVLLLALCLTVAVSAKEATNREQGEEDRAELLTSAQTLANHLAGEPQLGDRQVRLIDIRPLEDYQAGNIRGARHVDVGEWKAAFGDGTNAKAWSERLSENGLIAKQNDQTVVVYDRATTPSATRIWWILKYWGVEDVRVLDGGFAAWQASGGEVSPHATSVSSPPSGYEATPHPDRLATIEQVRAATGDNATCLVDTRTEQENTAGKIPSARHLDWQQLVTAETGKLRPLGQLQQLFDHVGYDPENPTITYCQSGGRASMMAFAMEHATGKPVANYYGSWGEWSKRQQETEESGQ